jgi:photosystem II stability/assembly factor-like uncharacterized protein
MPRPVSRLPLPRATAALLGAAVLALHPACRRSAAPPPTLPTAGAPFWERQPAGEQAAAGASLRAVRAVSERVAWASGSRGTVLRTTDGGATWARRAVAGADSLDFRSMWAFDSLRAVVASAGEAAEGQAQIYRTSDGGRTWALAHQDTTRGVFYDAVAFWDEAHGLLLSDPVDGRFVVLVTDDGGRRWRRTPTDGMPPALAGEAAFAAGNAALAVAARTHGWFVTGGPGGARVWHTSTGGARWDVAAAPVAPRGASAGLFAVAFRSAASGVAVGGDYRVARTGTRQIVRTDDGVRWLTADAGEAAAGVLVGARVRAGGGRDGGGRRGRCRDRRLARRRAHVGGGGHGDAARRRVRGAGCGVGGGAGRARGEGAAGALSA